MPSLPRNIEVYILVHFLKYFQMKETCLQVLLKINIALTSPVNTSFDLAMSIFIFIPTLFLFLVLNVVSTLVKLDFSGDFAL